METAQTALECFAQKVAPAGSQKRGAIRQECEHPRHHFQKVRIYHYHLYSSI